MGRFGHWLRAAFSGGDIEEGERYVENDSRKWSIFLCVASLAIVASRRVSLAEILKHLAPGLDPLSGTPALFNDLYRAFWWLIGILLVFLTSSPWPFQWLWWWPLFLIVQRVQSIFFHELWRNHFAEHPNMRRVHNRLRTSLHTFFDFGYVTLVFALAYRWAGPNALSQSLDDGMQAIYFSSMVGTTLGFGDIHANHANPYGQFLIVAQLFSSLFLLSMVIASSVGAINPLQDSPQDSPRERPAVGSLRDP